MNTSNEIFDVLQKAEQICTQQSQNRGVGLFCEHVFDGLLCWPATPAGQLAFQPCSNLLIKATGKGMASRQCTFNGQWYVPENFTKSWTNYSECGKFYIEKTIPTPIYSLWIPIIKKITHLGYGLSIISLISALLIFLSIKRLHCSRNRLHTHLFISFIMRALMSLLKDGLFVKGTALTHDTIYIKGQPSFSKENYSWICKAIVSLWHYFIMSNYMFLLMEGTYLHNLMFLNLFSENGVAIYCILGWGIPLFFLSCWIGLKYFYEDVFCWTKKENKFISWLIDIPIGATVIVNFVLFIIIIRILFVKLTSMYIQQRRIKYRKLLKSTLFLVPLFGIPYTISLTLSIYVTESQTLEVLWLFFDQTFTAFQGLFASLVYCLLNSEVQIELKRKYNSFKDRNHRQFKRNRTISNTQQTSIPLNDEFFDLQQNNKKEQLLKTSDLF